MKSTMLVLVLLAVAANAQMPPASPANSQPSTANHYLGATSCSNSGCHGSTHPLDATRVLQN